MNRILLIIAILLLLIQLSFSFYYSSELITQNNLINNNQNSLELLEIENQELRIKLASASAITRIASDSASKNYTDITNSIKISN